MKKCSFLYEVEWNYTNSYSICYTERKGFDSKEEVYAFAEEKHSKPNVYKVRTIVIETWKDATL